MEDARLLIAIAPAPGAVPIRLPVQKAITTVGSAPEADIRVAGAAAEWAVIRAESDALTVSFRATGARHRLAPGDRIGQDGIELACERAGGGRLALDELAGKLAAADDPDSALAVVLEASIAAAGASHGAIIVTDDGAYRVALAVDAAGNRLDNAAELLSDTIVRDVLGSGKRTSLADALAHERYAAVPSVVSLSLRSVACLPMRIDGRAVGAIFLGKQRAGAPFSDRLVADLEVLAAMSVPLVAQLRARAAVPGGDATGELVGDSAAMVRLRELIGRVGPSDLSVLVLGESGTGKELVARAIHAASARADRPLIALNCASVPESLLGAELFGYRRGAFTGADTDRGGLIEAADGSTLFLDEVGDMPAPMQAALLRVLEQKEVKRLGETAPRPVDFRLVAATHRDLSAGDFRQDLLFRLQEVTAQLPPLRDRGDDVMLLAHLFLRQAERQLALRSHGIGRAAEAALRAHPWPGNVRELRATMRRAAVLADGDALQPGDLQLPGSGDARDGELELGDLDRPLAEARDGFVDRYVRAVLERHDGNREAAARALGIGVRTLYRYLS
jgi:DNA-binding NtrC family response regulator